MIKSRLWLAVLALAVVAVSGHVLGVERRMMLDTSPERFRAAAEVADSPAISAAERTIAIDEMVRADVFQAVSVLEKLRTKYDGNTRAELLETMAALGLKDGLDAQRECLRRGTCRRPHKSARLLGLRPRPEDASLLRMVASNAEGRGRIVDGVWRGNADDRALLECALRSLARAGRPEDQAFVVEIVRRQPRTDLLFLEILGYCVGDREARSLLRERREQLGDGDGAKETIVLALARSGDMDAALEIAKRIEFAKDEDSCPVSEWLRNARGRDRATMYEPVLRRLRSGNEGRCTPLAWKAIGMMRPQGEGRRILELALSKRPYWKSVPRDILNRAVIAIDPELNGEFWAAFDVESPSAMAGERKLVKFGVPNLLFRDMGEWNGD